MLRIPQHPIIVPVPVAAAIVATIVRGRRCDRVRIGGVDGRRGPGGFGGHGSDVINTVGFRPSTVVKGALIFGAFG
jgi:hypothetical protein